MKRVDIFRAFSSVFFQMCHATKSCESDLKKQKNICACPAFPALVNQNNRKCCHLPQRYWDLESRSPESGRVLEMASVCRMHFAFPLVSSFFFFLQTCMAIFFSLWPPMRICFFFTHDIPQPSLCLLCLSARSSLWPRCSTGGSRLEYWFTWGKSMCSKGVLFVCPVILPSPPVPLHPVLPLTGRRFLFLTQILERSLPSCREQIFPLIEQRSEVRWRKNRIQVSYFKFSQNPVKL